MFERPIPAVDAVEAHRRLAEAPVESRPGALLIDVRELHEFVEVRAEGSLLLPLSQLLVRHRELPMDRPLLMICRSGGRSAQATAFLLAAGWSDVTNVAGGTIGWLTAGLPVRAGLPEPGEELGG
jgi:rhodanese-related sulfurtransferase